MGDNYAIIVQIVAVVLILFFCFVTYMNTKTWRATHVVFLFLVFGAAITFSVYASLILKTRKAWQEKVEKLAKQEVETEQKVADVIHGNSKDPAQQLGIIHYAGAVYRTTVDRGRVWRNLKHLGTTAEAPNPDNGEAIVDVRLQTADGDGADVEESELKPNDVVYAFVYENPTEPLTEMQYVYVGKFFATEVTKTTISLRSTAPISGLDQELAALTSPWVLYERMPTDSNEVFAYDGDALNPAVQPSDSLKATNFSVFEIEEALYNETLWEYQRDGMTLEQVNQDRVAHDQKPLTPEEEHERMFAKVQYLKDFTVRIDAPMASTARDGTDQIFDSNGQTLDPRLRVGGEGEVKFAAGDHGEMILHGFSDSATGATEKGATELAEEGILKIEQTVYRRSLNDYAYEFAHLKAKRDEIYRTMRLVDYELGVVAAEIADSKKNYALRQIENAALTDDQTQLKAELAKITRYTDDLEAAYRQERDQLSKIYRENSVLHDRIVAANEKLTRQIESRSETPTAIER